MASLTSVSEYETNSPGKQNYISDSFQHSVKDNHGYIRTHIKPYSLKSQAAKFAISDLY